jgi:hypothetical protein
MGDGPAIITGGLGGWQVVPRQDDVGSTDWEGQEPLTQDVPLLLDGFPDDESVEREWNTVKKLGRDAVGDERVPPVFKVWGPIEYGGEGKAWILPDNGIQPNAQSIIRRDDGELLRIEFTLSLLEYIRPDTIKRHKKKKSKRGNPAKTGGTAFPGTSYTVRKGDSLVSIAKDLYGDWKRWADIGKLNGLHDANRQLPAGMKLRLP